MWEELLAQCRAEQIEPVYPLGPAPGAGRAARPGRQRTPDRAGPCDRKLGAASLMGQRLTNQVIAALFRLRRGG
jgi:hypothetical protein